jgi:hypothetical protein
MLSELIQILFMNSNTLCEFIKMIYVNCEFNICLIVNYNIQLLSMKCYFDRCLTVNYHIIQMLDVNSFKNSNL